MNLKPTKQSSLPPRHESVTPPNAGRSAADASFVRDVPGVKRSRRVGKKRPRRLFLASLRTLVIAGLFTFTLLIPVGRWVQINYVNSDAAWAFSKLGTSWLALGNESNGYIDQNLSQPQGMQVRLNADPKCRFASLGSGNGVDPGKPKPDSILFPLQPGVFHQTSPFGLRLAPVAGVGTFHTGTDFAAPIGTPIHALAAGVVEVADWKYDTGNEVVIKHDINGEVFYTKYFHMRDGSLLVKAGQQVTAGQQIGEIGSTGFSTGPHLHLEVHPDQPNNPIDPIPWLNSHNFKYLGETCEN